MKSIEDPKTQSIFHMQFSSLNLAKETNSWQSRHKDTETQSLIFQFLDNIILNNCKNKMQIMSQSPY